MIWSLSQATDGVKTVPFSYTFRFSEFCFLLIFPPKMESEYTEMLTVSAGFRERATALCVLVLFSGSLLNSAATISLNSLSHLDSLASSAEVWGWRTWGLSSLGLDRTYGPVSCLDPTLALPSTLAANEVWLWFPFTSSLCGLQPSDTGVEVLFVIPSINYKTSHQLPSTAVLKAYENFWILSMPREPSCRAKLRPVLCRTTLCHWLYSERASLGRLVSSPKWQNESGGEALLSYWERRSKIFLSSWLMDIDYFLSLPMKERHPEFWISC